MPRSTTSALAIEEAPLFGDIHTLIEEAQRRTATAVNAELSLLYYRIGRRIHTYLLDGKRADYGKKIIRRLSQGLTAAHGKGWGEKQLWQCMRLAETFPDEDLVYTLCREISWSHLRAVMFIENPLKRDFYIEMCRLEGWSVRRLQERMRSLLFERTAISKKPDELIRRELDSLRRHGQSSPALTFRDPYVLDFLGLSDCYSESDLEDAILRDIERFLLELGAGFSFVARQKRLQIDSDDFYLDLLFYNRKLRRLVALELKIAEFEPAFKGQMELYLRWLSKFEQEPGEEAPLGIILCAGKKQEQIELLELDKSGIHVAEFWTVLPPREVLEARLHQSIEAAKQRLLGK